MSLKICARNNTLNIIKIRDLGISINPNENIILTDLFDKVYLCRSKELKNRINEGSIIINDETIDFSISDAILMLYIETEYEDIKSLELIWNVGDTPPETPNSGDSWFQQDLGLIYNYDVNRGVYVSSARMYLPYYNNVAKNIYLAYLGTISDINASFLFPRDAIITSLSGSIQESILTGPIIRVETLSNELIYEFSFDGNNIIIIDNLSINIDKETQLKCFVSTSKNVKSCLISIEYAWRYDVV